MFLMRASFWLFSQDCATNTANAPNTTATTIMSNALIRKTFYSANKVCPCSLIEARPQCGIREGNRCNCFMMKRA